MQTPRQSLIESLNNTALGFVISYASSFLIFPLMGIDSSPGKNLVITLYFTVISIIRGYAIRRWYNRRFLKKLEKEQLKLEAEQAEQQELIRFVEGISNVASLVAEEQALNKSS